MATIHDEIDNWLAADLHGELSNNERSALACASGRLQLHAEKLIRKSKL